jgi:hypothetical protein
MAMEIGLFLNLFGNLLGFGEVFGENQKIIKSSLQPLNTSTPKSPFK